MSTLRICFVAAPLIARSGVYNSTIELVQAARASGHEWSAIIGCSRSAGGAASTSDGITEFDAEPSGLRGVIGLARLLSQHPDLARADLVVSMVPQADMALSLLRVPWVAYLRGLPWPGPNESSRVRTAAWRSLERLALRRSRDVWCTTRLLAEEVGATVTRIVPPGLTPPDIGVTPHGRRFVWAARYSRDKNAELFLAALAATPSIQGVMHGSGPLAEEIRSLAPPNVRVGGWVARRDVWQDARAYVGTSAREAFGRSAVEAALVGLPVVISDAFGCAEMLYTDPELSRLFVLPVGEVSRWSDAVQALNDDDALRTRAAAHVQMNARRLTIDSAVQNLNAAARDVLGLG